MTPIARVPLRCHLCGDLIGAYEPVIVQANDAVRETSRAAEPGLSPLEARLYHRECYGSPLEQTQAATQ
jgi:hypothetical protein